MESSFGTRPSEGPYRKWHSPAPEMVQNESRPVPVPVMVDCQFGDRTKENFEKWNPKKDSTGRVPLLEMGVPFPVPTGKLRSWVLT